MAKEQFTVGIIGLGLIGGSAALRLRATGFASRLLGHDSNPQHAARALELGLVDSLATTEEMARASDIVIIAVPVNAAPKVLQQVMAAVPETALVVDFGSTKQRLCALADGLPNRSQYVACHPIAGTEYTGPEAAFSTLYAGKVNIICDREHSSAQALGRALQLTAALGMRPRYMDSRDHDRHIAYVSHLSHVSSFMLGQTVLEVEPDEKNIFDMAGSGFASTVRLAKSSPAMWAPIFTENAANLLAVLDRYIANLHNFKELIAAGDEQALYELMKKINVIRKVLDRETTDETIETDKPETIKQA